MARFIGDSDKMQLDNIDDEEVIKNLCIICKVDMGPNNPRQLCRKTYCENEEGFKLCENTDCEKFPPDWDSEEDTEETYQEGQWKKCCLCDGYFDDDGLGDILFIEEEPNNQRAGCNLCGKDRNIVQMKGTGQYICQAACDESEDESDEECEEEKEDTEKIANCDLCCKDKSFETYYVFKRGRKQELFSCVKCWENRETQLVEAGSWTWTYHSFPGPAFYTVNKEEEDDKCIFNYYICKYCDYVTTNDDPDCSECKKELCMELFQSENQSEALLRKKSKNEPTVCTKDCACDPKCNEDEDDETHIYELHNAYKKTIYSTEQWNNILKNGKHVRYEITTNFYWGTFEVELTDKEKNELLEKDEIVLNHIPGCSFEQLDSGVEEVQELVNKDTYTEEELKEIHRLLYFDEDDKESYDPECDDDVEEDTLQINDWSMDDTIYGIDTGGCILELRSD